MKKELSLSSKLLPGIIALFILFGYYIINDNLMGFYPWLGETLIIYAAWFFLLRVIVKTIVEREFDKSFSIPIIIGVVALTAAIVLLNMTWEDIFLRIVNATILWSFIYTIFGYVKERVNER